MSSARSFFGAVWRSVWVVRFFKQLLLVGYMISGISFMHTILSRTVFIHWLSMRKYIYSQVTELVVEGGWRENAFLFQLSSKFWVFSSFLLRAPLIFFHNFCCVHLWFSGLVCGVLFFFSWICCSGWGWFVLAVPFWKKERWESACSLIFKPGHFGGMICTLLLSPGC